MGNSDNLFVIETAKMALRRFKVHSTWPPCGLYFYHHEFKVGKMHQELLNVLSRYNQLYAALHMGHSRSYCRSRAPTDTNGESM